MIDIGWEAGLATPSHVTVGKLLVWEALAAWDVTFSVGENGDRR
jgi:hypothetical protein